ncbi:MAG: COX15/CtaA family protein [Proteobacteria bacterium]|nr:COX15/CtaA family protein [Pseudomonadota bacterium]
MAVPPSYDYAPVAAIMAAGALLALVPLAWAWRGWRGSTPAERLRALTVVALFLTFDLVLFGAFTRLTDSGLGCPDWPGCYGNASPLGAHADIHAAQALMPQGPVTHVKAWIEMIHRYLATTVGALIVVLAVASWAIARRGRAAISPWWATATLVWVCLQGAFGAWTVTMKLYPAIVTAHLLGGLGLVALLAVQAERYRPRPVVLSRGLRAAVVGVAVLALAQIALGGWVSTNYAVLACTEFPACQGSWWPPMDFEAGFTLLRPLGLSADGKFLPFAALTAIHVAHRLLAGVVLAALLLLAWRLHAQPALRPWARGLVAIALWQLASGLGNVLLGWPLIAAVAHTGGAAALMLLLATWLARVHASAQGMPVSAGLASATGSGRLGAAS